MTKIELLECGRFGLTFACGTCGLTLSATFVHVKAGIGLSHCKSRSLESTLSPSRLAVVATEGERLSISCGNCRSGKTIVTLSREADGISCSTENYVNLHVNKFEKKLKDFGL